VSHHVLVAEDEADIRELLRLALTGAGYEVETAPDGAAAWELAVARPPALVVTDLRMPAMNGLELIRALRDAPALRRVPVILFTAFVSSDPRVAEAGAISDVEVVTKGSIGELRQAVTRLLGAGAA
jgi:CheY-like chemotaxis protein